jgi:Uma2 family endonuclease
MTAMPWPDHLLTLAEFTALPEDNSRRYELEEGVLVVTPRPAKLHQRVIYKLVPLLNEQLPHEWEAFGEVDVIVDSHEPATVRIPDVVVARSDDNQLAKAAEVLLAVEVISPGSRRRDTKVKPMEYAEAGIPHYWVIDLEPPISLRVFHLAGTYYQEAPDVTGRFSTTEPFALSFDLNELVTRG